MMFELLTQAVGGAAIEIFVQQHPRPHRHSQWAFWDHSRRWRRRHNTWELGAPARRLVARALDAPKVGLDLNFDDIARFDTWKRRQCLATLRTVFGRLAQVMNFHHHGQHRTITATVSLRTRLLAPLSSGGISGLATSLGTSGLLALLPVEALIEVAYLRFKPFHLRL